MRIRKCASRLLGSAYSSAPPAPAPRFELPLPLPLPPPPPPYPDRGPESCSGGAVFAAATASGDPCELSRSPWDLIGELDLSDPQEEDLVGRYFVHVACRASWLFPTSMPAASVKKEEELAVAAVHEDSAWPRQEVATKPPAPAKKHVVKKKEKEEKKESEPKKAKVKKEESDGDAAGVGAQAWTCKKNDGKRWYCQRPVSRPNSLCDYHFEQKRSYYNPVSDSLSASALVAASSAPAASKPSTSSKPRRKKSGDAGEGFYYYTGFGPFRTKRHCRSSSMQESTPAKKEEEEAPPPEDHAAPTAGQADDTDHQAAARDDESSCDDIAGIAGGDEESSDDNGNYTHGCNGNGKPRAVVNGDTKRKTPWKKRWRKPVKARSLKSLM